MKISKKILIFFLLTSMVFFLAACGLLGPKTLFVKDKITGNISGMELLSHNKNLTSFEIIL